MCFKLSLGQQIPNQSISGVQPFITAVPATSPPTSAPNEIFRFAPGNVTQLDLNGQGSAPATNFDFTNSRWFSLGRVTTGANTAYGLRFQLPNKSVTFGYQSVNDINPRIQWIGTGASLGNLEFRVANAFSTPTGPALTTLVASMNADGSTVFGENINFTTPTFGPSRVTILNSNDAGLTIENTNQLNFQNASIGLIINQNAGFSENVGAQLSTNNFTFGCLNVGLKLDTSSGADGSAVGISAVSSGTTIGSIGVKGEVDGASFFGAGIYGVAPLLPNQFAGFFDGRVQATGGFSRPSDRRLKTDIAPAKNYLERITQLSPVTYKFIETPELNLEQGLQHGFIAQDLEKIFPELVTTFNKPKFDKNGKPTATFEYKTVNYMGMISILAGGIKDLNDELKLLK